MWLQFSFGDAKKLYIIVSKGLRSRATDATPPIEFEKRFCFAAGAWGCLENLSDFQNLSEFVSADRIWLTATTARPWNSPDSRGNQGSASELIAEPI